MVMSQDEAKRLFAMARNFKSRVLVSLVNCCGLCAGEVVRVKAGDVDSTQGIIRVMQAKGRKDRHVMLSKDLLALLRQWWRVRPTRHENCVLSSVPCRWPSPRPAATPAYGRLFASQKTQTSSERNGLDAPGVVPPSVKRSKFAFRITTLMI